MATAPSGEEWKDMDSVQRSVDFSQYAAEVNAAKQRILDIRRSDAEIRLTDHQGRPIKNREFRVEQTRSDFKWGENLWGLDTLLRHGYAGSDRVRHYSQLFKDCLNSANCLTYWTEAPRNDGPKHMEFQGEDKLDNFEAQVNWALQHGLTPKGHPIFWSLPKAYPEWLKRYPMDTQWKFIEVRVRNLVARYKGKVKLWDVINEAMWEAAPKNLPHRFWPHMESLDNICEYIIPVMQWAREEDPDAKYIINDYGMEVDAPGKQLHDKDGHPVTAKSQRDRYTALFRRLREEGACPDGLGIQAHTGAWMTPVEQNEILDDLATGGVPLHITEFWAHTHHLIGAGMDPEEAHEKKAEYIAQVMTLAFAHPKVDAFYFWGDINESFGFKSDHNSNGIATSSNRPTKVYERVKHLLRNEWMTRETVRTDADGVLRFRGFHGDYSLRTQTPAGQPVGIPFSVLPEHSGVQSFRLNAL
jgi:endo-1,4-beta-xylanase